MKVIFLDIDGVLKEEDYRAEFKDECFRRLKEIVDATGAEIILSSSWRIHYWEFVENGYENGYDYRQRTLPDADVDRAIAILNRDNNAVIEEQF